MSTISVQDLFRKYLDETISPEEFSQLCDLVNGGADPEALEELLRASFSNPAYAAQGKDHDLKEVFASLRERIGQNRAERVVAAPVVRLYRGSGSWRKRWIVAAACLIGLIVASLFIWERRGPGSGMSKAIVALAPHAVKNDVSPGHNGAILTLANGEEIVLDSARNGSIAVQGTTKISKLDGRLDYTSLNERPSEILYNKLTTPRARTTNLILADGTGVWLNAASSIRYPIVFGGKERQVEITGEVYFEVAKNAAMPFVVKRAHSDEVIQVLGTSFNVNAYDDEDDMKTTLLEGSVKVIRGQKSSLLKPGQQAILDNSDDKIDVIDGANTNEVMAWKNGRFQFSNMDLRTIMRQLT
ncbi:MAG TPA: FecR domain-containing protein, partial [Puia sp.]